MKSGTQLLVIGLASLFAITITTATCLGIIFGLVNNQQLAFGITCDGTPLYGMNKKTAAAFLQKTAEKKLTQKAIILTYGEHKWEITPQEINLQADIDTTLEQAYAIGRSKNPLKNIADELTCAVYGKNLAFSVTCDETKLQSKLQQIAKSIDVPAKNATFLLEANGQLKLVPAVEGKKVDIQGLTETLLTKASALELPVHTEIHPDTLPPKITDTDLNNIDSVLASYTTTFYAGDSNRSDNIAIAAKTIDNCLIKSGSEFSFNGTVGSRLAAAGYKNAPVILEGKVQDDIGGGVCQVSSTLYNAILLAGLAPTARTSHFYPSNYVPPGLDATVADGQIDFKFRNNLPHNVFLMTSIYDGHLTFYVLGHKSDLEGKQIRLATKYEKPAPAPVVSVYRIYSKNGQDISEEFLHTDHYYSAS